MHATPTGPIENVPQKIPILHPHQIINRPKKSALKECRHLFFYLADNIPINLIPQQRADELSALAVVGDHRTNSAQPQPQIQALPFSNLLRFYP
jgi:hypothetical protein